jgi:hypothetical protein
MWDAAATTARFTSALTTRTSRSPATSGRSHGPSGHRPAGGASIIEPPNATSKDASFLNAFEKTSPRPRQTWDGYLRVWNESHWHGHPTKNPKGFSNPNHVLELHPAWRLTLDDGTERSYSVARIEGFRGYGLNKFDTDDYEFHALNPAEWLKVYQTSASLYVQLVHTANFFSLPVIVRDREDVAGVAQILELDVCADRQCSSGSFILQDLRGVTVAAADNNLQFTVGNKIDLLGIFSVNPARGRWRTRRVRPRRTTPKRFPRHWSSSYSARRSAPSATANAPNDGGASRRIGFDVWRVDCGRGVPSAADVRNGCSCVSRRGEASGR